MGIVSITVQSIPERRPSESPMKPVINEITALAHLNRTPQNVGMFMRYILQLSIRIRAHYEPPL